MEMWERNETQENKRGNEQMIITHHNCGVNGLAVHGQYEQVGSIWRLRKFRVSFDDNNRRIEGEFQEVHGNQRKDIGVLKLVLRELPTKFVTVH